MAHHAVPCPRCGCSTYRRHLPLLLRPLRLVAAGVQWRSCMTCSWRGLVRAAVHATPETLPHQRERG